MDNLYECASRLNFPFTNYFSRIGQKSQSSSSADAVNQCHWRIAEDIGFTGRGRQPLDPVGIPNNEDLASAFMARRWCMKGCIHDYLQVIAGNGSFLKK